MVYSLLQPKTETLCTSISQIQTIDGLWKLVWKNKEWVNIFEHSYREIILKGLILGNHWHCNYIKITVLFKLFLKYLKEQKLQQLLQWILPSKKKYWHIENYVFLFVHLLAHHIISLPPSLPTSLFFTSYFFSPSLPLLSLSLSSHPLVSLRNWFHKSPWIPKSADAQVLFIKWHNILHNLWTSPVYSKPYLGYHT
jgi:hypothetical protein